MIPVTATSQGDYETRMTIIQQQQQQQQTHSARYVLGTILTALRDQLTQSL